MNEINYDKLMLEEMAKFEEGQKPTLLLHACCAPCSSGVLFRIGDYFKITLLFYNPNIYPESEYIKRKDEISKLAAIKGIDVIDCDYDQKDFEGIACGLENEIEGGSRCEKCYYLRMEKCAALAKGKFDYFCTTLSISPHKNVKIINNIGERLQEIFGVKFLPNDFKKQNGYLQSINQSKELGLYRQDYCGCKYSKGNHE